MEKDKNINIECYEYGGDKDKNKENESIYINQFAKAYLNTFQTAMGVNTYHGLGVKNEPVQSTDIHYLQLEPKFKWFKPPLSIKIFKWEINMSWAYKIHKAYLLKNCIPVSMSSTISDAKNNDASEDKEITINFQCKSYTNDDVKKAADDFKKKFKQGPLPSLANDWDGDYVWDQTLGAFRAPRYEGEVGDQIDFDTLKMDPNCDLLLGNKNENSSDKQYPNCVQCHRYEICREYFSKKGDNK